MPKHLPAVLREVYISVDDSSAAEFKAKQVPLIRPLSPLVPFRAWCLCPSYSRNRCLAHPFRLALAKTNASEIDNTFELSTISG
jgi:hypothetical protein